jgi:2-polyprenyl-3-methyl-5-hydroxy-6-metoxy-1,4-benzoquinol methylase
MSTEPNYLPDVQAQYEELPYPPRDPKEESKRLLPTILEHLDMLNHMCFQGKQQFKDGFKCLVAGGGTGDATIFLAEQLKSFEGAEVFHVDLSSASINICKERAAERGLSNITWLQESLLDVEKLGIGPFDYINCSGVLHHLESPSAGLNALKSVLKEDGAMGIMVYGAYGRMNIYPTQQALRCLNEGVEKHQEKIDNAKALLQSLPSQHFVHMNNMIDYEQQVYGDAGLYDLLLHSQDKAYSVTEVYDWVEGSGLEVLSFVDPLEHIRGYKAEWHIKDKKLLEKVKSLPIAKQRAVAEYIHGKQIKHCFYVAKNGVESHVASTRQQKLVPFFNGKAMDVHLTVANSIPANPVPGSDAVVGIGGRKVSLPINNTSAEIIRLIDGYNTIGTILKKAEKSLKKKGVKVKTQDIKNTFEVTFEKFHEAGGMWLRA